MEEEIEEFRDIPGYEGMYAVSNLANIKRLESFSHTHKYLKEIFLCKNISKAGYYRSRLSKDGKVKHFLVHQLVAMAFLGHKIDGHNLVVNHKDGDKTNNNVKNLEIITQRQNVTHGTLKFNSTSKYTGVHWNKKMNKWRTAIVISGKYKHLGLYKCELKAAYTYNMYLKNFLTHQQNL